MAGGQPWLPTDGRAMCQGEWPGVLNGNRGAEKGREVWTPQQEAEHQTDTACWETGRCASNVV